MKKLSEEMQKIQLDFEGLKMFKLVLQSSPACEYDEKLLALNEKTNLYKLYELNPSGGVISLFQYAQKKQKLILNKIDVIFVFANLEHIADLLDLPTKTSEYMRRAEFNINENNFDEYCLSHLILTAKIKEENDLIAITTLDKQVVTLYNLKNISHKEIVLDDLILVHMGSIIGKINKENYKKIQQVQKNKKILDLYKKINFIDYKKVFGKPI